MQERIIRDPEAANITGLSKSQRHELSRRGLFPEKVKLSNRASGYRLSELMAWLDSRPRASKAA